MNNEPEPVSYNEKGEVIIHDLRQPKYEEQPQYYYDSRNDQYYRQQTVAGRPVYVQVKYAD